MGGWRNGQACHRFPGSFLVILKTPFNKKALVPRREQGQKIHFLRYHLVCRKIRPLCTVPTHRLPVNAGIASEDTLENPFPPALSGPFAAPLFAPFSAPGTLCGCALQFYFRLNGFGIRLCFLYYSCVRLSRTNFLQRRTNVPCEQK